MKALKVCPVCKKDLVYVGNDKLINTYCFYNKAVKGKIYHFFQEYKAENYDVINLYFLLGEYSVNIYYVDGGKIYINRENDLPKNASVDLILKGKNSLLEPDFSDLDLLKNRIENILILK